MPISLITSGRSLDQDRWRQIKKGRQRLMLCRPYADAGIGAQREACRKRRCFSISTWRETTKQTATPLLNQAPSRHATI